MQAIETERLLLRPFTDADIAIHEVVFADPEVCRFYCGKTRSEQQVREWLIYRRWQAGSSDDLGFLAVVRKEDGQILGLVALQLLLGVWLRLEEDADSPFNPQLIELSYAFGRAFQGQGYAYEACHALMVHGFTSLRIARLTNDIDPENTPSIRLVEKLGFRPAANRHPDNRGPVWIRDNDLLG
ncbi:MAG TPA: GNAT family N-acetyltransferase [Herpetosiphonaceae bacterium]|nr:GNAT family N-acetyltransferase [Herpetosiphonaceae bacterium]